MEPLPVRMRGAPPSLRMPPAPVPSVSEPPRVSWPALMTKRRLPLMPISVLKACQLPVPTVKSPDRVNLLPATLLSLMLTGVGTEPSLAGIDMLDTVRPVRSLLENEFAAALRNVSDVVAPLVGAVPVQLRVSLQAAEEV
jgi:hypothetical protein